ncbi:MAG: tetratricopeptide repeat protein [Campylobacteraceae bacterium]|nr:tetratricopeptide repeat protein [Campylobacteraceae bacterium]
MSNILSQLPWLAQQSKETLSRISKKVIEFELSEQIVVDWFSNFGSEEEQKLSIKIFFLMDYRTHIHSINTIKLHKNIINKSVHKLNCKNIILISSDENTDSSNRFIYDLAKEWEITKSHVFRKSELTDNVIKDKDNFFIFFNDTHGTGTQFVREFKNVIISIGEQSCGIISIVMTGSALSNFKKEFPEIQLIQPNCQSTKNIDNYRDEQELNSSDINILEKLGKEVYSKGILGYKNTALLVAFSHQCPNNTLPIIWANGINNEVNGKGYPWKPLFEYKKLKEIKSKINEDDIKESKNIVLIEENIESIQIDSNKKNISIFNVPFLSKEDGAIGIQDKLKEVHITLENTSKTNIGQLVLFQGIGGLGKTQLAVEYAYQYKDSYEGVVWLTIDQDIDEQLLELGEKNSWINKEIEIEIKLKIVKKRFSKLTNILLILDNVDKVEEIENICQKLSNNKILITSRNAIQGFKSIELETLNEKNSLKLLAHESNRKISEEEIKYAKKIFVELDGLPLALEMAGAYVEYLGLSWEEYFFLYKEEGISFLEESKIRSFTNHENNIAKTLSLSKTLLKENKLLDDVIYLLSWGANEPLDKKLIAIILNEKSTSLIKSIALGLKLKFIKKTEDGYTLHRLVKDIWKEKEKLDVNFSEKVSKNLSQYMKKIKDDFLKLREMDKSSIQAKTWANQIDDKYLKASLINYSIYPDYHRGKYSIAINEMKHIYKLFKNDIDSEIHSEILNNMGCLTDFLGNSKEGIVFYKKALEMKRRIYYGIDNPALSTTLSSLGRIYKSFGKYEDAKLLFEEALEMRKRLYPSINHADIVDSLFDMGSIFKAVEKYEDAKIYYDKALKMTQNLYPNINHPLLASSLFSMGDILQLFGKYNDAKSFLEDALEMRKNLYPDINHPQISNSLNSLGSILRHMKKYKEAKIYYIQALEMRKNLYPDIDHPDIADSLNSIGIILHNNKYLKDAYEMGERLFGKEHLDTITFAFNYGQNLCEIISTRTKGILFLKDLKKYLITNNKDLNIVNALLKKHDKKIGRNNSKRKKNKV